MYLKNGIYFNFRRGRLQPYCYIICYNSHVVLKLETFCLFSNNFCSLLEFRRRYWKLLRLLLWPRKKDQNRCVPPYKLNVENVWLN